MRLLLLVLMIAALPACGGSGSDGVPAPIEPPPRPGEPPPPPGEPPATPVTVTYAALAGDVPNPERGFFRWIDLVAGGDYSSVRAAGSTLCIARVQLDNYRTSPLDEWILTALGNGLSRVRASGLKLILRFAYNNGPYPNSAPDASKAWILHHIAQLKPILQANADVIAIFQAGFIGAWGEWHSSTNGLENDTDRRDILTAILDAVPASRMVQVRSPHFKVGALGGWALAESEAFTGTPRARTGHHNDSLLSSPDDSTTYRAPVEDWKNYVAQEGRFTPIGGETNTYNPPSTDGPSAVAEMARLHFSFLSPIYHWRVVDIWKQQGYFEIIRSRLGYRLSMESAAYTPLAPPGGVVELEVVLTNSGFASMYNARPVFAVIDNGSTRLEARLNSIDPRRWEGGSTISVKTRLRIPATLAEGTYKLSLRLPDEAATLRDRPEYSVRFANEGVWDPARGENVLTHGFSVDRSAPGAVDLTATTFAEEP